MTQFITLSGTRYNVNHIVNYSADDRGGSYVVLSVMTDENAVADRVTETPEQIDALLGGMAGPEAETVAAALEAEAARLDDEAAAIHNSGMRGDTKFRAKAFRDAARMARAAISSARGEA